MHSPLLHSTYDNSAAPAHRASPAEFLLTHPLLPLVSNAFFSSLFWILLTLALYGVYTLILAH
jgi:hypothetical protein